MRKKKKNLEGWWSSWSMKKKKNKEKKLEGWSSLSLIWKRKKKKTQRAGRLCDQGKKKILKKNRRLVVSVINQKKKNRGLFVFVINLKKKKIRGLVVFVINEKKKSFCGVDTQDMPHRVVYLVLGPDGVLLSDHPPSCWPFGMKESGQPLENGCSVGVRCRHSIEPCAPLCFESFYGVDTQDMPDCVRFSGFGSRPCFAI